MAEYNNADWTPTVSVIVPVFCVEMYLKRCVESLLHQTYSDFEIILVDDGSDDGCPQICDQYAKEYENIRAVHQTNQGLSGARNTGLQVARGEYIAFVDSDDWVHAEYLNVLVQNIGDAVQCGCGYKIVNEYIEEPSLETRKIFACTGAQALKRDECRIYAWARIYRKTYIAGTRFSLELKNSSEDRAFNAELLAKHLNEKCVIVDNQLYYYYQRPGSLSKEQVFSDLPSIRKMISITEETKCDMLLEYLIEWLYSKKQSGFHIGNPPDFATVEKYLKICEKMIDEIISHPLHRIKYKTIINYPRIYSTGIKVWILAARAKRKICSWCR